MNLLDPGLVFRRDIGRFAESIKVAKFELVQFPTLLIFLNGKEVHRTTGLKTAGQVKQILRTFVPNQDSKGRL